MLIFDIETDGLLDTVSMIHLICIKDTETGAEETYTDATHYDMDVRGDAAGDIIERTGTIADGIDRLWAADCLAGANICGYDIPVLERLASFRLPTDTLLFDTVIAGKVIFPDIKGMDFGAVNKGIIPKAFVKSGMVGRHGVKAWAHRVKAFSDYGVFRDNPIDIQLKGDFNPKDFGYTWENVPFLSAMDSYCKDDVRATHSIIQYFQQHKLYRPSAVYRECRAAHIIKTQCMHGVRFDEEAAMKLLSELQERYAELQDQCANAFPNWYVPDGPFVVTPSCSGKGLFMPRRDHSGHGYVEGAPLTKVKCNVFNPTSRQQIGDRFINVHGWTPVELTDKGAPKVDETTLKSLPYPMSSEIAELLMINKRLGQLANGKQAWLAHYDKATGRIYGDIDTLGTVSSRCAHKNPNLGQVPSVRNPYGTECRALFIPSDGRVMVGADADGLEGRCLGDALYPFDNGAFITVILAGNKAEGTDLHTRNMRSMGMSSRDNAKTAFYAWLYGCADPTLGAYYVGDLPKEKQLEFMERYSPGPERQSAYAAIGRRVRSGLLKGIPGMERLIKSVQQEASTGYITALDGRKLRVRAKNSALNLKLQGAGAIVMKEALIQSDKLLKKDVGSRNYDFVLNVHDEFQLEAVPDLADAAGQCMRAGIIRAGEVLGMSCPLDAEYKIGASWAETH